MKSMNWSGPATCAGVGESGFWTDFHMIFAIRAPSGKARPLVGAPPPVGVDHGAVANDDLEQIIDLADRDDLPVLVSPELVEPQTIGNLQAVFLCPGVPAR